MIIGFFYSRYVNAVLQFSVLIFSFPFLFFILFGHIKPQKPIVNLIIVFIIVSTTIFSLVKEQQHYTLFYNSRYQKIFENHEQAHREHEKTVSIIDLVEEDISQYYQDKIPVISPFVCFDSIADEKSLVSFVKKQAEKSDYLYLGCVATNPPFTVPIIREYFPTIKWQQNYAGATTYLFSKENTTDTFYFLDTASYFIDSLTEYSPTFSKPLFDIISNRYNFIDVSVKFFVTENYDDIILVASLETETKNVHWCGTPFSNFINREDVGNWVTVHLSVKLSDIYLRYKNIQLKVYVWNKGLNNFSIKDLSIRVRDGNPVIYK